MLFGAGAVYPVIVAELIAAVAAGAVHRVCVTTW